MTDFTTFGFYPNSEIQLVKTFNRLDSCRGCGSYLKVKTICVICEQPEQIHCASCYHYVDDPVHTECVIA